jgi:YfiH family protein
VSSGVAVLTDSGLRSESGIVVAFTERSGGVSEPPFDSLNLAAHVGDRPEAVDENRRRALAALELGEQAERLTTAEQVHGDHVFCVPEGDAGAGARAGSGSPPVPGTDALLTLEKDLPLLMCYADCVPIVLVARGPKRGISVVHAGWRGALAGLPGTAAKRLVEVTDAGPDGLLGYIGPHIGSCCYNVDEGRISQFRNSFDTIAAVGEGLDLAAAVRESLEHAGLRSSAIVDAGQCTSDHTQRFFSYRIAKVTGRHGAIAAIV